MRRMRTKARQGTNGRSRLLANSDGIRAFLSSERLESKYDQFINRWKHGGKGNQNYVKGRSFEYTGIKKFRKAGFVCLRSFGSLGPFDYLAYRNGICYLAQAKWSASLATSPFGHDLSRLIRVAAECGGVAVFQGIGK